MTNWSVAATLAWLASPPASATGGGSGGVRRRTELWLEDTYTHQSTGPRAEAARPATLINGTPGTVIIERIRHGDRDAFSSLYLAFYDRLWRLAVILGESPEIGQELVQEIFLSLWTRRESLELREDVAVYLLSAVRHRVYKSKRHSKVVSRFEEAVNQSGNQTFEQDHAVEDIELDADRLRGAIEAALESLSSRERAALMLRWGVERTYDEIGTILGVSSMGAHKMVSRALARVRPLLEHYKD